MEEEGRGRRKVDTISRQTYSESMLFQENLGTKIIFFAILLV